MTSLCSVAWDSFNVNFFVIGTPELLRGQPATYVTSFYLPPTREPLLAELIRGRQLDLGRSLNIFQGILKQTFSANIDRIGTG